MQKTTTNMNFFLYVCHFEGLDKKEGGDKHSQRVQPTTHMYYLLLIFFYIKVSILIIQVHIESLLSTKHKQGITKGMGGYEGHS